MGEACAGRRERGQSLSYCDARSEEGQTGGRAGPAQGPLCQMSSCKATQGPQRAGSLRTPQLLAAHLVLKSTGKAMLLQLPSLGSR